MSKKLLFAPLAVLLLAATACGSDSKSSSDTAAPATTTAPQLPPPLPPPLPPRPASGHDGRTDNRRCLHRQDRLHGAVHR